MKPVELEIFLQDGLSPGLKKAGQTVARFSDESKKELKEITESLKLQKSYVSGMEKEYARLEKSLKNAAPGKSWMEAQAKLKAYKSELEGERAAIRQLEEEQRRLKAESENAGQSLRMQLRNVREEIATLLLAYRSLTDAEKQTAQGRELARHIDELTEKAGELNDAIVDTSQAVTNAASDTRGFDQLAGGMQLVVDGFGLATAGAQALGLSEADLIEVQTRLQTALVASNALTSMQVNLQGQSALMQGVNTIQTNAAATAETIRTWAVGRGVIATKAATVAQAAFNAVAKANPYVLLAMAIVTVVGALYAFAKGNDAAKKAEEERQAQLERTKEINGEIARSIGESAGSQIAAYNKLQRAWKALGDDMSKRRKFVDENKKAFQELGLSVNNVKDAEAVLVNNTSNVVQSFVLRAKAAALDKAVTGAYSTMIEKQELARRNARYGVKSKGDEVSYADAKARGMKGVREVAHDHYAVTSAGVGRTWKTYTYEVSDAQTYNSESNRLALQERDRQIKAAASEAEKRVGDLQKEIGATEDALAALRIPQMAATTVESQSKTVPGKDERLEAVRKAAEELRKLRWQNEQDEIDQMADSAERRRRQIALDYEKQCAEIDKMRDDFAARNKEAGTVGLNEYGLTTEQQEQITRAQESADAAMKAGTDNLYKELLDKYQSYADQRKEIEERYNSEIAELRKARLQAESAGDAEAVARIDRSMAEAIKSKGKELMAHDFDVLRQSPDYIRAFEDLRGTSTETLNELLSQLEKAKTAASSVLDPQDLREYTTTIREIMDELDSRDPFGALSKRAQELSVAQRELAAAKRQLDTVTNGGKIFTGLKSEGVDANGKPVIVATYLSMGEALKKYTEAKDRHVRASNNFVKAEKEARDSVSQLTEAIKGVGNAIGGTAGEIVGLIMDIGSFVTDTIDGIATVQKVGVEAVSAVEKASIILALVSTAVQLLQKISELGNNKAFKEYEAYAEKVKEINALTDAVSQYRIAVMDARHEEDTWFAEDGLRNLRNWREYHDEVYAAYVKKAAEAQAIYRNQSGGGWLTGAFNWVMGNLSALSWWDEWRDIWGQGGYKEGTTAAINNLRIETRKKSSGFLGSGIGGHSQKTEDLVSWARKNGLGELFDDRGLIDKELARSILDNYGNKLVGQTKETLEALIELREKYDEYLQNLHEYVSSLYEPLVGNFVDGLWDWLDNGKDALDSFKEYASDTFRNIVTDMLRTIVLDKVVGSFSDDISALYEKYAEGKMTEQELMGEVAKLTAGLIDRYGSNLPTLEGLLETVAGMFDKAGIDIRHPDDPDSESQSQSQSGRAGVYTAMSQDQGTKLEGIGTSIQMHTVSIDGNVEDVSQKMGVALDRLAKIEENTGDTARNTREINEKLDQIIRDGIKI